MAAQEAAVAQKQVEELRSQLGDYADKFGQFQDTLTQSNGTLTSFRKQMTKMAKTISQLQADNSSLRKNKAQSDLELINSIEQVRYNCSSTIATPVLPQNGKWSRCHTLSTL